MELLHRCRDHAHKFYSDLLIAAEKNLNEALFQQAEQCNSSDEQRQYFEAMQALKGRSDAMHTAFSQQLGASFKAFEQGTEQERSMDDRIDVGDLSLVQREDLEDELAVSVIVSKANSRNSETLWKLNRRLAVLRGGKNVSDETNPFGPAAVCDALRHALSQMTLDSKAKIFIYKQLGKIFIISFGKELDALNAILMENGILPNLKFSLAKQTNGSPAPEVDGEQPTTPAAEQLVESSTAIANQQQLYSAIRELQAKTGPRSHTAGGISLGSIATDGTGGSDSFSAIDYIRALSAIQQSKEYLSAASQGQALSVDKMEESLVGKLSEAADDQAHHKMTRDDADTVDLVGMIFRYMLDDPNLHDAVKSMLSHLHTPYLKLALMDKTFLDNYQHSARLLLNTMADVGARWVKEDQDRTVLPKIKAIVEHILKGFVDDITLFDRLLEDFSRFRENLEKRAKMVEQRNTESQQGLERLELARQQAADELENRLQKAEIPPLVCDLLRQPWTDFLSYNLLRHGEESLTWQSALKVLDGVVWSVRPSQIARNKEDLHRHQQELDQTVSEGLSTIGYDPEASKTLINALKEAQELVYHGVMMDAVNPAEANNTTTSQGNTQTGTPQSTGGDAQQDGKPVATEPPKAEKVAESTPKKPLARPQKPLKAEPPILSAAEQEMVEKLKEIAFGTWFDFDRDNIVQRLKLAWYSRVTSHYMFVDQAGIKQAVENQANLAKGMCAGTIRVVTPNKKSFMERALSAVLEKLKLN